jgi:hypothetical protein
MNNPTLSDLIGGIQAVTLGDDEARRRGTQKTVLERKAPPTFDVLVEIQSWDEVTVYRDVAGAVDDLLRSEEPQAELRKRDADGVISAQMSVDVPRELHTDRQQYGSMRKSGGSWRDRDRGNGSGRTRGAPLTIGAQGPMRIRSVNAAPPGPVSNAAPQRIYPFGVSRDRLERAIGNLHVPATIVRDMGDATMVMTLKSYYRQGAERVRQAEDRGVPVYVLRNNTIAQMERQLATVFHISLDDEPSGRDGGEDEETHARLETEDAITQVLNGERQVVELTPRSNYIRRLQHQMAERYNVRSESQGREPHRRVKIYR